MSYVTLNSKTQKVHITQCGTELETARAYFNYNRPPAETNHTGADGKHLMCRIVNCHKYESKTELDILFYFAFYVSICLEYGFKWSLSFISYEKKSSGSLAYIMVNVKYDLIV